jgi:K+-transporting ATPase ATPase C chain
MSRRAQKMNKKNYMTAIRLAVLSLIMCGLLFPLIVSGLAQVFFPSQANGDIVKLNGRDIGSSLIAQNFTSPMFFHPRNDSASGVDPDITVQDAYSQIPRINSATKIPSDTLKTLVDQNTEKTLWIAGDQYVNVLNLNLLLIKQYPQTYHAFGGRIFRRIFLVRTPTGRSLRLQRQRLQR